MKTYLLLFCCLCSVGLAHAQNQASDFTGNKSDQARNPRNDLMNFVPNEVLVKFKDAVPMAVGARLKAAGISSIDKVLAAHGITSLEKLFPAEQKPLKVRMMKSPQGKDMKIPALDKIYRVSVPIATTNSTVPTNIFQLIEELKALPEVDYAEPNYIYSIDNTQPVGPILTAEDVSKMQTPKQKSTNDLVIPNDPLYGQQWYIPAVKADSVWQQTTGDTTQVIAILDTGVDWNHPDLKNKIWTNPNPATSWNMDGIMDDIRGWDFINNDNNPMDDNSHGTHVAGIAAAETNNGIGIAGVCPKAKIMPIKVFQSSGRGDAATITKGIIYASTHGATVINMSFGSYARSLTMEDALANAYATTILVAAAGNDGLFIGPLPPFFLASYPAALSFVLGVQVPYTSFSNYDQDGSVFSDYPDLLNYEMKAPGTNILSTIPNGNYRVYQGTSMAAPIVSGAVCLYKNRHPNDSQELMWGNLINTTSTFLDIDSAIKITPKPKLMFVTKLITDTIVGDDKDGIVDAGETIELTYTIRNTWGQCDSVMLGLNFGEFEDKTTAQIITPTAFIGSVSSYATKSNKYNPLKILINKNVANNRDIQFLASLWYPNSTDTIKQKLILNVTNGEELSGVMDTTLILTSDKLWIVNKSFRITGHLIIEPGTKLIINNTIDNRGIITAIGKTDSIIDISGPKSIQGGSNGEFKYTRFHDINESLGSSYTGAGSMNFENCIFEGMNSLNAPINVGYGLFTSYNLKMTDCLIRNSFVNTVFAYAHQPLDFKRNTVDNILSRGGSNTQSMYNSPIRYNNFLRFKDYEYVTFGLEKYSKFLMCKDNNENGGISLLQNNILASTFEHIYFYKADGNSNIYNIPQQYWGTTDPLKIDPVVYDFNDNSGLPEIRFKPMMVAPSDSAHAIVWKVLVNGKDAQDEFVEPVGVGKQRFDVYFNRAMDNTVIPKVSFGVRYPYSQQSVNEEGTWSEDTKIYTVYKTIKLTTGDGINIVRVAGAKEINGWEHEIPIEDSRFSFIISAANAASTEFMATQGLGKVKLEWNNSDLEDGLGYNMYRMEHINDSTLTEAVMINPTLITDTLYTDFAVTPNKKYYYYYKVMRTNMSETDPSKVVSAIPFTASKGDANGDLNVNVLDITTIVAYLLNNNPQPFIREAADLNNDNNINVLDIVGVVNKILNVPQNAPSIAMTKQVELFMQNDTLFANSNVPVGGIQLDIKGISSVEDIQILKALDGFESGNSLRSDSLRLIFYSMSGKNIPAGERIPLLKLKTGSTIVNAIFGETNGSPIKVNYILTRIGNISNNMNQTVAELGQNFPNPLNFQTTIPMRIYEPVEEAVLRIVNMMGQEVKVISMKYPTIGEHLLQWDAGTNKGLFVYTLEIKSGNQRQICPIKKMIVQ